MPCRSSFLVPSRLLSIASSHPSSTVEHLNARYEAIHAIAVSCAERLTHNSELVSVNTTIPSGLLTIFRSPVDLKVAVAADVVTKPVKGSSSRSSSATERELGGVRPRAHSGVSPGSSAKSERDNMNRKLSARDTGHCEPRRRNPSVDELGMYGQSSRN